MQFISLSLQHFRNYSKQTFLFSPEVTVIVGVNTAGKSNLIEAIFLLATGKSFKAEKDTQMIQFGYQTGRVIGEAEINGEKEKLEVALAEGGVGARAYSKRFFVNGVARRRVDFAGIIPALLFVPSDLDIIISSPSQRRDFFDTVLEMTDRAYRMATIAYDKALRHRNALLDLSKETGVRSQEQFEYWDHLLIENGNYLTTRRQEFIDFINEEKKTLLPFVATYDMSVVSKERLEQYKGAEAGSGVTLVGPHRDDFFVDIYDRSGEQKNVKHYGSRGQQRLVVLQLKLLQLAYIEQKLDQRPLLLLDDIFSELDTAHIQDVLEVITKQQTIITTTHKEFLANNLPKKSLVIELEQKVD